MVKPKTQVRCKICGYVMDEEKLEKMKAEAEAISAASKAAKEAGNTEKAKKIAAKAPVCPACGVSYKLFEIYEDPVEPGRRAFLHLDLHPVIVHAPQALTFVMLILGALTFILPAGWNASIFPTLTVLGIALPLTVFGAFFSGMIDAKVRFKKVATPVLAQKMILGALFFVLTLAMAYYTIWGQLAENTANLILELIINAAALGVSTILGLIGSKLIQAIFVKMGPPPKKEAPAKPAAAPST